MASIIKANQLQDFGGNSILTSDGSGTVTINSAQMKMTPAFHVKLSSTQDTTDNTVTKIQFDEEAFDTDNCYDNSTNYRFTPTVAGKYFVYASFINRSSTTNQLTNARTFIYKNGSEVHGAYTTDFRNNTGFVALSYMGALVEMNGTTDYIEYYSRVDHSNGSNAGVQDRSYAGAYKIIGA